MFSKKHKIPREEVKKVISEGQTCRSELFLIKKRKNGLDENRFVVVVSKKVESKAVYRNLIRRRTKGVIKKFFNKQDRIEQADFVFLSQSAVKEKTSGQISSDLETKTDFMLN